MALYDHQEMEDFILETRGIQEASMYNFVNERQLFESIAAAYATDVRVYARSLDLILDSIRQAIGLPARLDRFLVLEHTDTSAPLYKEAYADSVGARIDLGSSVRPYLDTDSPVRWQGNDSVYITLASGGDRGTHIWTRTRNMIPRMHLMAVNLPARFESENGAVTVEFLDDGLQQIFVYTAFALEFEGEGFEMRRVSDRVVRLSKSGERSVIRISELRGTFLEPQVDDRVIRVIIDGRDVSFGGQDPVFIDGRTYIPIRDVFVRLGYDFIWDNETQVITIADDDDIIEIIIGSSEFTKNGIIYSLSAPARFVDGTIMMPMREVLESLGLGMHWDPVRQEVFIILP